LGRSWGCPALPENLNRPIIDKIKNGSCMFIYSSNENYLKRSKFLIS
ncbi:MAG: murein L,D-transpeptidase catalytic domain-containing protein, partial [Ferruginibacter sp.]